MFVVLLLLSSLDRSFAIAKHQSREILKMAEILGLCAGMRRFSSKFREVQSSINCVSWDMFLGLNKILQFGLAIRAAFISSGNRRRRTSAVALQQARMCSIDSTDSEHNLQVGSSCEGLSRCFLSEERKSPVKNFRWCLSFLASCTIEDV